MRVIFDYTQGVAKRLIGKSLVIRFVHWPRREGDTWRACYGAGHLLGLSLFDYNVGVLGKQWFENGVTEDTDSLILHELGHEFCTNHADELLPALDQARCQAQSHCAGSTGMVSSFSAKLGRRRRKPMVWFFTNPWVKIAQGLVYVIGLRHLLLHTTPRRMGFEREKVVAVSRRVW